MLLFRVALGAITTLSLLAQPVSAQSQRRESTPFIIHGQVTAGPAIGQDASAPPGQALIVQPATSIRAARLNADTPSLAGFRKTKVFAAGTPMFGVYTVTGWAYCAVAESGATWWTGDEFVCYEDADGDGRFETAMHSGSPFLGVPLFVFQLGRKQPLPEPAPYSAIEAENGPAVDYVVTAQVQRPRSVAPNTPPVTVVTLRGGFRQGVNSLPTMIGGWSTSTRVQHGETSRINLKGAEIDILGVEEGDIVRFRVVSAAPKQVQRITMGVTSSTTVTPIFIPG